MKKILVALVTLLTLVAFGSAVMAQAPVKPADKPAAPAATDKPAAPSAEKPKAETPKAGAKPAETKSAEKAPEKK